MHHHAWHFVVGSGAGTHESSFHTELPLKEFPGTNKMHFKNSFLFSFFQLWVLAQFLYETQYLTFQSKGNRVKFRRLFQVLYERKCLICSLLITLCTRKFLNCELIVVEVTGLAWWVFDFRSWPKFPETHLFSNVCVQGQGSNYCQKAEAVMWSWNVG